MKKVFGILVVTVFTTSSAFGGLVSLFPDRQEVQPSDQSTLVNFDITLETVDGGQFGSFDIVFGSEDGLLMNNVDVQDGGPIFDFWLGLNGLSINCEGSGCFDGSVDPPFYPAGAPIPGANAELQGFVLVNPPFVAPLEAPIALGILTVEVPGGLLPGVYNILMDGALDGRSNVILSPSLVTEVLFGAFGARGGPAIAGQIMVTPEPATLALLGVGGLVALRRRRRKA